MNLPTWLQYTIITILVSTPFYLKMRSEESPKSPQFTQNMRSLLFIPGIVAFAFRVIGGTGFSDIHLGIGRYPWLFLVAILFPILMELLLVFACTLFNLVKPDREIFNIQNGQAQPSNRIQLLLGTQPQSVYFLIANLFVTMLMGVLLTLVFSLSEEFGWRGFLQGNTLNIFGVSWGLVMSGLAWGAWYIPLVFMGYKFPDYPRLGAFLYMPIATISMGIVFGFLFWLSGSLWVPALTNASTQVSSNLSTAILGESANSQRVRIVWLWLWAVVAGLCLALWQSGVI